MSFHGLFPLQGGKVRGGPGRGAPILCVIYYIVQGGQRIGEGLFKDNVAGLTAGLADKADFSMRMALSTALHIS